MPSYRVEYSWLVPSIARATIEAPTAEAAFAEAKRLLAEGEVSGEEMCWDASTSTEITGLWAGEVTYSGPDLRPDSEVLATSYAIAREAAPEALADMQSIFDAVRAHDDALDRAEAVPTGDDYNHIFALINAWAGAKNEGRANG